MKTKAELEQDIIHITMKIHHEFPELSKYIAEMPLKVSGTDTEGVDKKSFKEYYNSLNELVSEYSKTHLAQHDSNDSENLKFPGYPHYPPSEDIYNVGKKEMELNSSDIFKNKIPKEELETMNETDFYEDMSGDDSDVPGSELDDQQESVGSEDEENNYYSIGGDNHNNLEEDKG